MIVGRGVTTCLICDKNGVHVVNNMATVLGIKLLFDTDEVFHNFMHTFMLCNSMPLLVFLV